MNSQEARQNVSSWDEKSADEEKRNKKQEIYLSDTQGERVKNIFGLHLTQNLFSNVLKTRHFFSARPSRHAPSRDKTADT